MELTAPAPRRELRSTLQDPSGMLPAMARATHTFVGRAREIETLRDGVLDATRGHGGLWLVTGEAGIGKSRLVEEVARLAADHDVHVLWGRCWEAGGAPAHWPWIQVLRGVIERGLLDDTQVQALADVMPELHGQGDRVSATASLEPEQARFRWMDAVTRALRSAALRAPLLLLLEDLHAADPSTLLLLSFVTRQARDSRLLLVGTLRDAETQRADARPLFDRLAPDAHHVPLSPLRHEEVHAYVTRMLDREPAPALVRSVYEITEGNPLFVGELTRFVLRSGTTLVPQANNLPHGIRATIRARLALLSEPTRQALNVASVLGRDARRTTLSALMQRTQPNASLDRALDEACTAEVLLEVTPGLLRFSHVLLQQVLYNDLDDGQRTALHAELAQQLEREGAGASERAHHWIAAGVPHARQAANAALEAAREAEIQHALTERAHWYTHALDALTRAQGSAAERCEVLLSLGHAQIAAHEIEAGRRSCLAAATLARELRDAERLARASLAFGAVYTIGDVVQPLVTLLQEALSALPTEDSCLRARVMARLAAALQPAADPEPPIVLAREAIAMARRIGEPHALMSTIAAGCSAMMDLGDAVECRALQREHVALAQQLADPAEEFRAQLRLVFTSYDLGDHAGWRAAVAACRELSQQLQQPHYVWRTAALQAMVAMAEGRFAAATTALDEAKRLGDQASDPNVGRTHASQQLMLLRLRGLSQALPGAIAELERQVPRTSALLGMMTVYIGGLLARAGDRAGALTRHAEIVSERDFVPQDSTLFDSAADLAVAANDQRMMRALSEAGAGRADRWCTGGVFGFTFDQPVARNLGRLAMGLGDTRAALAHYETALAQLQPSGLRALWTWVAHEAAEVAQLAGQAARARALRDEADAAARELGITLQPDPLWQSRTPTLSPLPSPTSPVPQVASLTIAREGDVWRLDCEGRVLRMKDGKGMALLARLVESPGRELHVLDLAVADGPIDRGDAGELLDAKARATYQARVAHLREEIEDAQQRNDLGHAERARTELEQITQQLAQSVGLGGRSRRAGEATERARVNVQRRLRETIHRIREHDAALGMHLDWAIKTGTYCSYLRR